MQCLLRLYKCQENGETRCKDVELCQKPVEPINSSQKPVEPIVSEPDEINQSVVPVTTSKPATATSSRPALQNPVSSSGSSESKFTWQQDFLSIQWLLIRITSDRFSDVKGSQPYLMLIKEATRQFVLFNTFSVFNDDKESQAYLMLLKSRSRKPNNEIELNKENKDLFFLT